MGDGDGTVTYDIGGVYELVMVKRVDGYSGHYTNLKTGMTCTFSAPGMSKKQILTKFWDRAKEYQVA
jgi:hypothetical protein